MLLYRFPLIKLPMCYFDNLGCPMLWAALGSPGLLWVALGYPGLFGAAQSCSGGAVVQIHTWMYWGHMWHPWHLGYLGLFGAAQGCSGSALVQIRTWLHWGHMWHQSPKP